MSIFEKVIPFPERVRWMMLKAALESGSSASLIAVRLGWPLYKVQKTVMAPNFKVRLRDIGEWFWAIDPSITPDVKFVHGNQEGIGK